MIVIVNIAKRGKTSFLGRRKLRMVGKCDLHCKISHIQVAPNAPPLSDHEISKGNPTPNCFNNKNKHHKLSQINSIRKIRHRQDNGYRDGSCDIMSMFHSISRSPFKKNIDAL